MQVSVESTSAIERRMTIGVPAERIETEVEKRLKQTAQRAKIPGFRPGKVPMSVIRQRYEESARQEALGELIQSSFYEAVTAENLKPAGTPDVEPKVFEKGKDLEYIATFEVYPEIEVKELGEASIERLQAEVTDADVDNMLEVLRKQHTTFEKTTRSAETGDQVNIDFKGSIDGEVFEGGSGEGVDLVLGSGQMIPGFEDALVGIRTGESRIIKPTFPEDYQNAELAGKAAEFSIKANSVAEPKQPELNSEFFARFGVQDTDLEGFRAEVRKNMERELEQTTKSKVKNQVMDALIAAHETEVPKALITNEIDRLRAQAVQQFGGGSIKPEQLPAELFEEQAKRRVALGLIINEFVKKHELQADEERVKAFITDMAMAYQEPEQVVNWYYQNPNQLNEVRSVILEELVVETVLAQAKVSDKPVSYEEAVKPAQAPVAG